MQLSLRVQTEFRGHDRVVALHGCWANQAILDVELYHPTPGRQHLDCYQSALAACDKALQKFSRWLVEWEATHPELAQQQYRRTYSR